MHDQCSPKQKLKQNFRMGGAALWAESRKEIGQEYVIVPDFACL
jgi:hypothetical protein